MSSQPISIIGGGIGGLTAALALTRVGFNVRVYEQEPQLADVGAGIQLSPNASRILQQLGLLARAKRMGYLAKAIKLVNWQTGQPIGRFPINHRSAYKIQPYLHMHRADLHHLLLDALLAENPRALYENHQLIAMRYDKVRSETLLSMRVDGDIKNIATRLVIGADGIHSKVRETIHPEDNAQFTGAVAWRGLVPVKRLATSLRPDPCATLMMAPKHHFVCYYVRGGELLNYVAVIERKEWREESWTTKANLDEMLADFSGWNAQTRNILAQTDPESCYRWALYERKPLARWYQDQAILIGDSAHAMLPFLAQGAAMAIEDAWVLSNLLLQHKTDYPAAFKPFQNLRQPRINRLYAVARTNMKRYHYSNLLLRTLRDKYIHMQSQKNPEYLNKRFSWLYDYKPDAIA